jgi:hypothetical protein
MSDDDPVLVGQALPFSLKLMEILLQETPEHQGLLVSTSAAFIQYAQAYVLRPSRVLEVQDLTRARGERRRAKALFLRAARYAERALENSHPGIREELFERPESAVLRLEVDDVPAMFWLAAALGSAVSSDKNDMSLVADLPVTYALFDRALELDESWSDGAIHEAMISVEMGRSQNAAGRMDKVEYHFQRARELSGGRTVAPLVTMAESVCVRQQDRERFVRLLTEALEFDVDSHPDTRLANLLAQQHATWLLLRADALFIEDSSTRK